MFEHLIDKLTEILDSDERQSMIDDLQEIEKDKLNIMEDYINGLNDVSHMQVKVMRKINVLPK